MLKIMFISNDEAGFCDYIQVETGTSIAQLFEQRVPHGETTDYLIRVNRQPVPYDQVLQEGDRVSFTPVKIEGAVR